MFVVFCLETFAIFMPIYRLTSQVVFPDPNDADPDGLLAYGGDLRPQRLLLAYAQGIFPWPGETSWPLLLVYSHDGVTCPAATSTSRAAAAAGPSIARPRGFEALATERE